MMELIPAIDLIDEKCVRLLEGDFSHKTVYPERPVSMAQKFEKVGFRRLHIVDLEGAKMGALAHVDLLREICANTTLLVDYGGGVRTAQQVEEILLAGAYQVNLSSLAVSNPEIVQSWIRQFGSDKFFLGADVLNGFIVTKAWTEQSELTVLEFIRSWRDQGINTFFSTDVSKDGRLEGPALNLYASIRRAFPLIEIVASGGVSQVKDLFELEKTGVSGVIIGKALYENKMELKDLKPWINYAG